MRNVAIITGITSFLGKSTAKYLLSKGFVVFGILRPESKRKYAVNDIVGLKTIEMDFEKLSSKDFENAKNVLNKAVKKQANYLLNEANNDEPSILEGTIKQG